MNWEQVFVQCKGIVKTWFFVKQFNILGLDSLTGWCALLIPITVKTYLLPGLAAQPGSVTSIANFFLSAKRKKHFTTLL